MIIDAQSARIEWANRVARQSEEMVIIARATNDDGMRGELLGYARRLDEQVIRIRSEAA
jgi:hypothetical protein